MTHLLKLNNGARSLAASLLNIPEQFKTPADILRAGKLSILLEGENRQPPEDPGMFKGWADTDAHIEVTEAQRDMLKKSVETAIGKFPPTKYAVLLLDQLGFTE